MLIMGHWYLLGMSNTKLYYPVDLYFDSLSNSPVIAEFDGNNIVRYVLGGNGWTLVGDFTCHFNIF
jgi:hypothetical protein